ncbi:MAG: SUMF1/EgtB/PvdO family nonheme iron enzyme [bacterium]
MKNLNWWIKTVILLSSLVWCWLPSADAAVDIDVEMRLNDGGFVSFDHFKAELYLNNHGALTPGATIFGILEVLGEYFFWPLFSQDVDFEIHDIHPDESYILFLEFDFENIDAFIPFGPMRFWGAWFLDMESWNYDYQDFWFGAAQKWTPTPMPTDTPAKTSTPVPTSTPAVTSTPVPTSTPADTSTPTPMPTNTPASTDTPTPTSTSIPPMPSGDLYSTDPIVGNMRFVSAGSFTQGSPNTEPCRADFEGPQFTHILTRGIAVMETEVSRQMWADLKAAQGTLPADPSYTPYSPTMNNPVQRNTWFESVLFANLLSLANGFTQCYYKDAEYTIPVRASNYTTEPIYCNFNANGYRLPSEGEWEYFARAGTNGPFSCDEDYYNSDNCNSSWPGTHPTLEQYCVFCANNTGGTAVVGSKLPNPWNLKDVHGNVYEWCWDWFADSYPTGTVTDYVGPGSGSSRVGRGGGWANGAGGCRSAFRHWVLTPSDRWYSVGFRLVRTVSF